jgi:hypothetical protein
MRQKGGRVFDETPDTSFYTVNNGVRQKVSKEDFENEYNYYIGSGDSKVNYGMNITITYKQENGDHYLYYKNINSPY